MGWWSFYLCTVKKGCRHGEARRAALRGFVLGVFRIGDMVTSALKAFDPDSFIYSLHDHTAPAGEQLLWEHHPAKQSNAGALRSHRQKTNSAGLRFRNTYDMGDAIGQSSLPRRSVIFSPYRSWDVWAVLAGGCCLAAWWAPFCSRGRSVG